MKIKHGDVLTVTKGLILQQVNCQGQMGSGVAKAIYEKYPIVKSEYQKMSGPPYTQAKSGLELLGELQVIPVTDDLAIVNLYTQQFFGREGKRYTSYDALDTALTALRKIVDQTELTSADIHHPLLGAGLGGGNWRIISTIIEERLGLDTTVWVYP